MPQSITRLAIGKISKSAWDSAFKSIGFRRQANHLHRELADLFHGVHFQASQWGISEHGSFTINLVVVWESLYDNLLGQRFPSNPATAHYPFAWRIGTLMPGVQSDHWWDVDTATDLEALSEEVVEVLIDCAIPHFDQFPDRHAVLANLRDGGSAFSLHEGAVPSMRAIIAHDLGYLAEAQEQLKNTFHASTDAEDERQCRRLAAKLNLQID